MVVGASNMISDLRSIPILPIGFIREEIIIVPLYVHPKNLGTLEPSCVAYNQLMW